MTAWMRRLAAGVGLVLAAAGCGAADGAAPLAVVNDPRTDSFAGTLLTDPRVPRPALILPDTEGMPHDLQSANDGVTALFFGYTQCPDICPTAMADLAAAKRSLPAAAQDRVEVVFITEDPQRDTPQVLRTWLDHFDAEFVGLIGGNSDTARVLRSLHLPRTQRHTDPPGSAPHAHPEGDVDHSGIVYLFGPGDRRTVVHTGGTTQDQYAADITALLRS